MASGISHTYITYISVQLQLFNHHPVLRAYIPPQVNQAFLLDNYYAYGIIQQNLYFKQAQITQEKKIYLRPNHSTLPTCLSSLLNILGHSLDAMATDRAQSGIYIRAAKNFPVISHHCFCFVFKKTFLQLNFKGFTKGIWN